MPRTIKRIIWVLILIVAVIIIWNRIGQSKTYTFDFSNQSLGLKVESNPLKEIVKKNLQGQKGEYAIFIQSLGEDGEKYSLNELEVFPSASLYKLILAAAVLKEVEEGKITLEENLYSTKSYLAAVTGAVDYGYIDSPENINYSVQEGLERILTISDNFAAIMLTEKIKSLMGDDILNQTAKELGLKHTVFNGDLTTTAEDIATYFNRLFKGLVVSKTASDSIIDKLSRSKINDRLPAKLPPEVKIAHKTGELPLLRHDAGIVFLETKPYVIVLMSKNLEYEDDGVSVLATISKDVYDYFVSVKK